MQKSIILKKSDKKKQIVWAEVYAPDVVDSHGHFMTAPQIEKMAYNFAKNQRLDQVDVKHDNKLYGCCVVETFIAREDDSIFIPESWVVGVHVPSEELWAMIENQELNAFSMEVMAVMKSEEVTMELPVMLMGTTQKDNKDDHHHKWYVILGDNGDFLGGFTDVYEDNKGNRHKHNISKPTLTDKEEGHDHKYSVVDSIIEIVETVNNS